MNLGEIFRFILIFILAIVVFALIGGLFVNSDFGAFNLPIAFVLILVIFLSVFMFVESINDKKNDILKKRKEKQELQTFFQVEYQNQIKTKKILESVSDTQLINMLDEFNQGKVKNEMSKMLIEEEMVKRGLLRESMTKEKIDLLRKKIF